MAAKSIRDVLKNDEAVSISVGFILMFAVTVLIFTSVMLSFYTLSLQSEKTAMWESFKIMGHRLAIEITTVDSLISTANSFGGTVNDLDYEFTLPASVAAKTYSVNITNSTYKITLDSDNQATTTVPFNISANFTGIKLYSGAEDYKLKYDESTNSISIEEQ